MDTTKTGIPYRRYIIKRRAGDLIIYDDKNCYVKTVKSSRIRSAKIKIDIIIATERRKKW